MKNTRLSTRKICLTIALSICIFGMMPGAAEAIMPWSKNQGVKVGSPAPDFTFQDISGKAVSLHDFRGRKVFLFSWSSWCSCRYQLPDLEKFYREYKSDDFEIIAVASDSLGFVWAQHYLEKADATFISLDDPNNELGRTYSFWATQNGFLIDENGIVRMSAIGFFITDPDQRAELIKLIKTKFEPSVAHPKELTLPERIAAAESAQASNDVDFVKRLELAEMYRLSGNFAAAEKLLRVVVKSKSTSAEAHYRLGVVLYQQGKDKKGVREWKKARLLDPMNYLYMRNIQAFERPRKFFAELMGLPGGLRCKTCGSE